MGMGSWKIEVNTNGMPQKVATAMGEINETLVGAEYTPIAYLGSQLVNGTNHAVLAEQTVLTGHDSKNIVIIVFNEKPNDMHLTIVGIDRIVESGDGMGGVAVDVKTDIPAEAKTAWDDAFTGFVGSKVEPIALVGTQVVNGINYIFVAELTAVTAESEEKVCVVTVNDRLKTVDFTDILANRHEASLNYAFTW